jgi:hypothetical protein
VWTWGDLAQVRATAVFETTEKGFLEAHAEVRRGPLLAVTAGTVRCGEHRLKGRLAAAAAARRDYLWERDLRLRDPMLVQRVGPGAVSVRVFPVSVRAPTTVRLDGFALAAGVGLTGPRLYRTGDSFLAVLPRTPEAERAADLVDEARGRVLVFLTAGQATVRYGDRARTAVEVPCVDALRDALRGRGEKAVTGEALLVALPEGSRAPPHLAVGTSPRPALVPADRPRWTGPGDDPTPPPPPPPPPRAPAVAPPE